MTRLVAVLLISGAAFAQSSIQGVVVDPSGAAVPEATITAVSDGTSAARTVQTGADGRYRMTGLTIGSYTIRCSKGGFQTAEMKQIYLGLNQTVEKTIQLKLAAAGASIDVTEQPEALDTTTPTAATGISGETLEETPTQNRSYMGVVLMAPGVQRPVPIRCAPRRASAARRLTAASPSPGCAPATTASI